MPLSTVQHTALDAVFKEFSQKPVDEIRDELKRISSDITSIDIQLQERTPAAMGDAYALWRKKAKGARWHLIQRQRIIRDLLNERMGITSMQESSSTLLRDARDILAQMAEEVDFRDNEKALLDRLNDYLTHVPAPPPPTPPSP